MAITRRTKRLRCDHGLRRPALVQSLLTEVFRGRLRPGQHLVAGELARRFGVSQTPIREALIELAGIGIVDLLPNRGAVVRKITERDIREVCQVRRVLECAAVRNACSRIDPAELHALADDLRKLKTLPIPLGPSYIQKARDIDCRLHDLIVESCGNALLAKELGRLKILFRAFRDAAWERHRARNNHQRFAEESLEHLAIVEALLRDDARAAARAMARHIASGSRYWSRSVRNQEME